MWQNAGGSGGRRKRPCRGEPKMVCRRTAGLGRRMRAGMSMQAMPHVAGRLGVDRGARCGQSGGHFHGGNPPNPSKHCDPAVVSCSCGHGHARDGRPTSPRVLHAGHMRPPTRGRAKRGLWQISAWGVFQNTFARRRECGHGSCANDQWKPCRTLKIREAA